VPVACVVRFVSPASTSTGVRVAANVDSGAAPLMVSDPTCVTQNVTVVLKPGITQELARASGWRRTSTPAPHRWWLATPPAQSDKVEHRFATTTGPGSGSRSSDKNVCHPLCTEQQSRLAVMANAGAVMLRVWLM
jgi:hypothetical protein